ncbi:adiponectin receptor protein-like [Artemia franciscana]
MEKPSANDAPEFRDNVSIKQKGVSVSKALSQQPQTKIISDLQGIIPDNKRRSRSLSISNEGYEMRMTGIFNYREAFHKKRCPTVSPSSTELRKIVTSVKSGAKELLENDGQCTEKANELAYRCWNEASKQTDDITRYVKESAKALKDLPCNSVVSTNGNGKELVHQGIETSQKTLESVVKTAKFVREQRTLYDFRSLPKWLQDNEHIHLSHRPPLPSFKECFKSIFKVHTETGNIWTHLIGCLVFILVAIYFWVRADYIIDTEEKIICTVFFIGAIGCLGLSFLYHTLICHSENTNKIFLKLDLIGINFLIFGSFVPWLYYSFYCNHLTYIIYLSLVIALATASIIVSLFDKFSTPEYRSTRALVFVSFGVTGVIPCVHTAIAIGWSNSIYQTSLGWLLLMGLLYIVGATLHTFRMPERFFPGQCDIMFQSHQIFHVLVICAAFVHYHGIYEMAAHRRIVGKCPT